MENYIIKNEKIEVKISALGAEIQSLTFNGEQKFWAGDSTFWSGKSPILFPVCGRLKNCVYQYDGKNYEMMPHGFAKKSLFTLTSLKQEEATFLLRWSEETLKIYPFKFELYVTYRLEGSTLFVHYEIKNCGEDVMYCSIGSHESYFLNGDIEDYCLRFEKKENFHSYIVTPELVICRDFDNFGDDTDALPLGYHLVEHDTAIFPAVNSRRVDLIKNGENLATLNFDAPNLLIWTRPSAPFICLEPWFNLPDFDDANGLLIDKPGMIKIAPENTFISKHSITYHK